jgi:hypothetical protein
MVDFTRAFRLHKALYRPQNLGRVRKSVLENLRKLDTATVTAEVGGTLTNYEIAGVMARRDKLIAFFDAKIREKGEAVVFTGQ